MVRVAYRLEQSFRLPGRQQSVPHSGGSMQMQNRADDGEIDDHPRNIDGGG